MGKQQYKDFQFASRVLAFDKKHWKSGVEADVHIAKTKDDALNILLVETHFQLRGVVACLKDNNLRSAGCCLRAMLEATANAWWIMDDKSEENERATKYISSIKNLDEYLVSLQKNGKFGGVRIPKETLEWTTSNVEHRLNAFSPQAGLIWDYCSIFTHASGSYLGLNGSTDKLASFILVQATSYAVTARGMIANDSKLFKVSEQAELDKMVHQMADKLGVKVVNGEVVITSP